MGLNIQSNVTKDSITAVSNIVNKQVNKVAQTTRSTCTAINIETINIGTLAECGVRSVTLSGVTINANQIAKGSCFINAKNNITITNQQLVAIKSDLQELVTTQIKNNQGFIPAAISLQSNVSISETQIRTNINQLSISDITQVCDNTVRSFNTRTLNICADITDSTIAINQSADSYAVTQCTTTGIINNIFKNAIERKVAQETDTKLASKQSGLTGLFTWLIVIAAIVAVVLIIGLILYFVFSSGGDKKKKDGDESQLQQYILMQLEGKSGEGGSSGGSSINPLLLAEQLEKDKE